MIIAILGRQFKLGLAELESLADAKSVMPIGSVAATIDGIVDPNRLGGVTRLAKPLTEVNSSNWPAIERAIQKIIPDHIANLAEGKITLGISVFGINIGTKQLFAAGLELKKICRSQGRSVRIVPNAAAELNSAQVLHNGLTGTHGIELVIISDGRKTWVAQTEWVQDINAYAARDHGRPKRDAFVGMLPPKLAQIMLNLAQTKPRERILDPFCGTGVVLQEASLLGCLTYGTDISQKMIDYSAQNLEWLAKNHTVTPPTLNIGDATSYNWHPPIDHVVCEAYLGQPLSGLPSDQKLSEIINNCNTITKKFLQNIHPQLPKGARLCIAVPAWVTNGSLKHLQLLDQLADLGYNRVRFQLANWDDLIYHRENQIVARELLVLSVK